MNTKVMFAMLKMSGANQKFENHDIPADIEEAIIDSCAVLQNLTVKQKKKAIIEITKHMLKVIDALEMAGDLSEEGKEILTNIKDNPDSLEKPTEDDVREILESLD